MNKQNNFVKNEKMRGGDFLTSQNKIPKIIHYVWLGRGEKPEIVKRCIESWKKFCPDFEIIEWNENNFDVNSVPFVKEAIYHKKWAFASDYIRLYVLNKFGGVYLDTDMELYKNLTPLLKCGAFFGFENNWMIGSAIIGCVKKHFLIERFLQYYNNRHFVKRFHFLDQEPNTHIMGAILEREYNLSFNGKYMHWKDVEFYPADYFYPLNWFSHQITKTENTFGMHLYNNSWANGVKHNDVGGNKKYDDCKPKTEKQLQKLFKKKAIELQNAKKRVWRRLKKEKKRES